MIVLGDFDNHRLYTMPTIRFLSSYQLTLVSSCSSFIVLVSCVFRLSCVCLHCDSDSSFSSSSSLRRFFSSMICFRESLRSVRFRRDSFNCNFMSCNVADVFFNSFSRRNFPFTLSLLYPISSLHLPQMSDVAGGDPMLAH